MKKGKIPKNKKKNNDEEIINLTKRKRKREEEDDQMYKFKNNLVDDCFSDLGTDNTFCVFKSLNDTLYIVYPNKTISLIAFDLINNKKTTQIKNVHKKYITSLEYYQDKINKKDLIMSMSAKENNIKIWDFFNYECLFELNENEIKNKYLNLACFLNDNNNILIVRSGNKNNKIKVYNMEKTLIKEINESNFSVNVLCVYKNKINNLNSLDNNNNIQNIDFNTYIISINNDKIRVYDYNSNNLYNTYSSNIIKRINSICVNENIEQKTIKLIGLCNKGYILIWNFYNANLIEKLKFFDANLYGICLLNNEYLCFGHLKEINILNLNDKESIITLKHKHNNNVISIQKIFHPKYGECIISQDEKSDIKLWVKQH